MTEPFPQGPTWSDQKAWLKAEIETLRGQLEVVGTDQLQLFQGQIAAYRALIKSAEPQARPGKGSQGYGGSPNRA